MLLTSWWITDMQLPTRMSSRNVTQGLPTLPSILHRRPSGPHHSQPARFQLLTRLRRFLTSSLFNLSRRTARTSRTRRNPYRAISSHPLLCQQRTAGSFSFPLFLQVFFDYLLKIINKQLRQLSWKPSSIRQTTM